MASFEVWVKGHICKGGREATHGQLGVCPYSLRVLLVLEEKGMPYTLHFVDLANKPKWLTDVNPAGTVPVAKDVDHFIVDSDTICDYLEEKYAPEKEITKRVLGKIAEVPNPGSDVMSAFFEFLKDDSKRFELEAQLRQVEDTVNNDHPYMGGKDINAWDLAVAPRLFLARIGCKNLKGWDWGENFVHVKAYLHRVTGRPSWRNTASWDEDSITEELQEKMQQLMGKQEA